LLVILSNIGSIGAFILPHSGGIAFVLDGGGVALGQKPENPVVACQKVRNSPQ